MLILCCPVEKHNEVSHDTTNSPSTKSPSCGWLALSTHEDRHFPLGSSLLSHLEILNTSEHSTATTSLLDNTLLLGYTELSWRARWPKCQIPPYYIHWFNLTIEALQAFLEALAAIPETSMSKMIPWVERYLFLLEANVGVPAGVQGMKRLYHPPQQCIFCATEQGQEQWESLRPQ